jgi:hypothetical protein
VTPHTAGLPAKDRGVLFGNTLLGHNRPYLPRPEVCTGQAETAAGARELRRLVAQDLRDHPSVYRAWFAQDPARPRSASGWDEYVRVMGRNVAEWGDQLTLLAIARVLKLRIRVLAADGAQEDVGPADGRFVWMAFRRETHYDALLPVPPAGVPKVGASPAPKRPKPEA